MSFSLYGVAPIASLICNLNLAVQSVNKYFLRVLIWELDGVVKTQKFKSCVWPLLAFLGSGPT